MHAGTANVSPDYPRGNSVTHADIELSYEFVCGVVGGFCNLCVLVCVLVGPLVFLVRRLCVG